MRVGRTSSAWGSFTAKTVLRGNPAGSIAPVGRAALGISTLLYLTGSLEA